jgi:cytochrome c oxidase assembly protein subunit 15
MLRQLIRIELVLIYLVILAGSIVRMTGSGMGCPDWPKCFGFLIPPTERAQLEWKPYTEYNKGQIIIVGEGLQKARTDFHSSDAYQLFNWDPYTHHDYAVFNAWHTWIEYINRLLGALSGIPMVLIFLVGIRFIRADFYGFLLSTLALLLLGFEAWLGKLVVDGNLIPNQISLHMFGALSIVAVLTILLSRQDRGRKQPIGLRWMFPVMIGFLLLQIYFGTQVREEVDMIAKMLNGEDRETWVSRLGDEFIIHRSFSWGLVLASFVFAWVNRYNA